MNKERPIALFVHGWGVDTGVWACQRDDAFLPGFEKRFVELPGHGKSSASWDRTGLEPATNAVLEAIRESKAAGRPAYGVGWSLGAMALMNAEALHPGTFARLALVGATPCFVQRDDFEHGVTRPLIRRMVMDMKAAPGLTLAKFLRLNFTASEMNLPSVRGYLGLAELSGNVLDHTSLVLALETLGAIDLRSTLSSVKSDTLIVHGSEDMITPVGAAHFLKENMPNASLNVIPNAGHAPHLSMPDEFNRAIGNFFFC